MARVVRTRGRSQKRLTSWFQFNAVQSTIAAAGGAIVFSFNAAALSLRPFTVVRTRFELMLESDQSAAAERFGASWGIAVVSD